MNAYLNYLLEANFGICLFYAIYRLFLKKETDFRLVRMIMLTGLISSILLPLVHLNTTEQNSVLGDVIPPTWLPEIVVYANGPSSDVTTTLNNSFWWLSIDVVYATGVLVLLGLFMVRLIKMISFIYGSFKYRVEGYRIIESTSKSSSFSFFQFIFIGNADELSEEEKKQIIEHEVEHGRKLHSLDIILLHMLSIFFWFNPLIRTYKKIFIQLHEFEADARAVKSYDVNDYCNLLARVALLSADIKLANHFSNSLTLKRIEMMRTSKSKIKRWKLGVVLAILPVFFFIVSCQDQVMNEVSEVADNATMTLDLPVSVQTKLDEMKKANPNNKYIVVVPDEKDAEKTDAIERKLNSIDPVSINSMNIMKDVADSKGVKRTYIIVDYNEQVKEATRSYKTEEDVFTVVEQSATYPGGLEALGSFIGGNLVYPAEQRMKGIQGVVFVQFIVNKDGSLSDPTVLKSLDAGLDAEALKVVQQMPNWIPGKQDGKVVRQKFVLPISFKLN